ncbi:MAG: hypothetical protein NTY99_03985 [DPANN group archaeon]|nr:hypothetical protein [DPANN group archaeon]
MEETAELKEESKSKPDAFIEHIRSYAEKSCPKMGGSYTPRSCYDSASRLWALYQEFRYTETDDVLLRTLSNHLRTIAVSCGNGKCGDVMDGLDKLVSYLQDDQKKAKEAQASKQEGTKDGK